MLLIDKRRYVRSLMPYRAPVPFVREWFRHDVAAVHAFFQRCETDFGFTQALREELQRCLAWVPSAQPYPDALVEASERAIADGLIGVASMLPDNVAVEFDHDRSVEWDGLTTVMFADAAVAERFVADMLKTPKARAAFEAALAHPVGRRYLGAPRTLGAMSPDSRTPVDAASLSALASALLAVRHLGLLPRDASRRRLRLVWLEHAVALAVTASSTAPAPQRAPPPPPPSTAPASTLPDSPGDVSPQAQKLLEAAKNATPFCEECARLAAEQSDA